MSQTSAPRVGAFLFEKYQSISPGADLPKLTAALEAQQANNPHARPWYTIRNVSDSEAEVAIRDIIGFGGVTAGDFASEFSSIKAKQINLRVNSDGGDVFDGISIFNAIRRHPANVTAFIEGLAASAASFLVMAADQVVMEPHSQMMIHDASGFVLGPADLMRQQADVLDKASDNIASIYAERAGGTTEEWRALMKAETWLSDREAVDLGLADSIDGEDEADVAARLEAQKPPEQKPTDEPTDGPEETRPTPIDWRQAMQDIAAEDDAAVFAMKGETS